MAREGISSCLPAAAAVSVCSWLLGPRGGRLPVAPTTTATYTTTGHWRLRQTGVGQTELNRTRLFMIPERLVEL